MKKNQTYTKKQIVEAIKHWQNVLEQIDESSIILPPLSQLESTEYTKNGEKFIKFMSYRNI